MGAYFSFPDGVLSSTTLMFDGVLDESWDLENEVSSHPVEVGADVTDNVRVGLAKCQLTVFCTNEPFQANTFASPSMQQTSISIAASDGDRSAPDTLVAKEWDNKLNFQAALKGVGSLVGGAAGGGTGSIIGTAVGGIAGALLFAPGEVDKSFSPIGGLGIDGAGDESFQTQLLGQADNTIDFVVKLFSALETLRTSATLIDVYGSKNFRTNMVINSVNLHRDASTGTGAEFTISLQELRFVSTQTVTAPAATVPRAKPPAPKGPQNPKPSPPARNRSVMRSLATQSVKLGLGMLSPDQLEAAGLTPDDVAAIGAAGQ